LKDRYFKLKNLIGVILLASFVLWGCKKGDPSLGVNLLPGVKILDTRFHRDSTTILTDSKIRVESPKYNLFGSFNDPVFGRTDASFASQFRIVYNPVFKPLNSNQSPDSVFLYVAYKNVYGDTVTSQSFKVYELTGSLNTETKYLSSYNVKNLASTVSIGSGSFIPKFRLDSLTGDTLEHTIKIRLDADFGKKLFKIDSSKMVSNDVFINEFKGLYFESTPISSKGSLVSIDPLKTMIALYYTKLRNDSVVKDSVGYFVTANSANVSSYTHDYTTARFIPNLNQATNHDTLIYIQPTGGIKSRIKVSSLSNWKDSANYTINKATLTFHVDTTVSDYRKYLIPGRLFLMRDSTNIELFPRDATISNSYYGGYYDAASASYSFNITQHLQDLINGTIKTNEPFFLIQPERTASARRVVLKGFGSSKAVKLSVTYTKYK
jgi:hypothetical protein